MNLQLLNLKKEGQPADWIEFCRLGFFWICCCAKTWLSGTPVEQVASSWLGLSPEGDMASAMKKIYNLVLKKDFSVKPISRKLKEFFLEMWFIPGVVEAVGGVLWSKPLWRLILLDRLSNVPVEAFFNEAGGCGGRIISPAAAAEVIDGWCRLPPDCLFPVPEWALVLRAVLWLLIIRLVRNKLKNLSLSDLIIIQVTTYIFHPNTWWCLLHLHFHWHSDHLDMFLEKIPI